MLLQVGSAVWFDRPLTMAALPQRVEGTVTKIYIPSSTAEIQFKDQHAVSTKIRMALSRLYTAADTAPVDLDEQGDDNAKTLPSLSICADFVADPSPQQFRDLLFCFESIMLRWFSKARKPALKKWYSIAQAAPFNTRLAAPYNVLLHAFEVFDSLLLAAVLATVRPGVAETDDPRLHGHLESARSLVRTLHAGCRFLYWEGALQLWRVARTPDKPGGHLLMCNAMRAMESAGAHSCLKCLLTSPASCVHACCAQQFLYLGLSRSILHADNGYWRVSARHQESAAAAGDVSSAPPSPADSPRPPRPVTWDSLLQLQFPVIWENVRLFYRVDAKQDCCVFSNLAARVNLAGGAAALRQELASYIKQRSSTAWLQAMFRDTKSPADGKSLAAAADSVAKPASTMSLFCLHVLSLQQHLDVFVASPVWDGAPIPAEQLRRHHAKWKVAASEVLAEQKAPPQKVLLAHLSRLNPLSGSQRDRYMPASFLQVCCYAQCSSLSKSVACVYAVRCARCCSAGASRCQRCRCQRCRR